MLKSNTHKIGAMAMAAVMTMGAFMAGGVSVNAAAPNPGNTPVSYENRTVLPEGNGQYGIVIPTAIVFNDEADGNKSKADVEIVGLNGFKLTDFKALEVEVSILSANRYELREGTSTATKGEYAIGMTTTPEVNGGAAAGGTDAVVQVFDKNSQSGATAVQLTRALGVGTNNAEKVEGTATLKAKPTAKGNYTDTLTYSFNEVANEKK